MICWGDDQYGQTSGHLHLDMHTHAGNGSQINKSKALRLRLANVNDIKYNLSLVPSKRISADDYSIDADYHRYRNKNPSP